MSRRSILLSINTKFSKRNLVEDLIRKDIRKYHGDLPTVFENEIKKTTEKVKDAFFRRRFGLDENKYGKNIKIYFYLFIISKKASHIYFLIWLRK